MNNWYRKFSQIGVSEAHSYVSLFGFLFRVVISPFRNSIEVVDATIDNKKKLFFYAQFIDQDFTDKIEQEVSSRLSNFGVVENPIIIIINGVKFTIHISTEPPYINDWTIVDAEIINKNNFLQSLPQKLLEHIKTEAEHIKDSDELV